MNRQIKSVIIAAGIVLVVLSSAGCLTPSTPAPVNHCNVSAAPHWEEAKQTGNLLVARNWTTTTGDNNSGGYYGVKADCPLSANWRE